MHAYSHTYPHTYTHTHTHTHTHTRTHAHTHARARARTHTQGWVTDMAPLGQGAKASTHQTHINTPLDEVDGAARVLDPIFAHLNDNSKVPKGRFFKDYHVSFW